jgi:hypothetical protein
MYSNAITAAISVIPVVNLVWWGSVAARFGWFIAHYWNYFWWALLMGLFFQWFWLWILDAWGWIDMQWVYQIFAPLNDDGHYDIVDQWVVVNTWTLAYTREVIEKDTGVDFDPSNETHMQKLKDFVWPYIFEQMNLINVTSYSLWWLNTFWIFWCP